MQCSGHTTGKYTSVFQGRERRVEEGPGSWAFMGDQDSENKERSRRDDYIQEDRKG